jgi:hypothetical protein
LGLDTDFHVTSLLLFLVAPEDRLNQLLGSQIHPSQRIRQGKIKNKTFFTNPVLTPGADKLQEPMDVREDGGGPSKVSSLALYQVLT